jgi:hypothetical protein
MADWGRDKAKISLNPCFEVNLRYPAGMLGITGARFA